jgi:tRNA U34 5-carboxymethylaminomethyl modifying GTPase MnmE/TrmE
MVVSDVAHTTRDAIRSRIEYKGRKVEMIDTAGLNTPNLATNSE